MPAASIPVNEAARLKTLRSYSILDTLPEQELDDITELASFVCGTPISLISLVDHDRQWFKAKVGLDAQQTGRSESFCAHMLSDSRTLVVEDATLDPRFSGNPLVTGDPNIRFYAGAPLIAPNGHVIGSLCVIDTEPRQLTPQQFKALQALSRQVMVVFETRLAAIEAKRAAAALMQSEKLAAVGRVASSMAHEINNPLEAVTNLLFLARQNAIAPEVVRWLDEAEVELRRVSVIANQTLRFHKQATKPRPISCLDLFAATLNLYEGRLKNAGITIEKRKRANQPVKCFEGDIRQVISNLVTNAIDAMPFGGRLIVRSREATEWTTGRPGLALTVADTGHGINADTQSHIFEAFFTTKGIGGNGLGLWISADIMKRHYGSIKVRSSQGTKTGTVVILFLPFENAPQVDTYPDRPSTPATSA